MVDDGAILRRFPGDTSVEDAASALARVVERAVKGELAPDLLESARRALGVMSKTPDITALPGLLDTMYSGRNTFDLNTLSLSTGSLRVMLAMRPLITSPQHAARIIKVIAESCLSALRAKDEKIIRIATRYSKVGVQFTEAFDKAGIAHNERDDATASAISSVALTFGVSLNLGPNSATSIARFFEAVMLRTPSIMWRTALAPSASSDQDVIGRATTALYVSRWIISCDSDEKRAPWLQACRKAATSVLSALLDLLASHEKILLCSTPQSSTPSYATLLSLSIRDISLRFCDDTMLDELLCRVSSSSTLVYCAASLALAGLCLNHSGLQPRIHKMVRNAYSLARACATPHANERWQPLAKRLGLDGKSFTEAHSLLKQPSSDVKHEPIASVVHSAITSGANTMDCAEQLLLVGSQLRRIAN